MPALEIHDASLSFGARLLWSHLTLRVEPGQFVAVLGANGSGKTSLLRAILGQQHLTSGTITIAGHPTHRGSQDIGYVPPPGKHPLTFFRNEAIPQFRFEVKSTKKPKHTVDP